MNATSPLIHHDALLEINAKNIEALHDDVATAAKPAQPVTARPRPHGSEPWQVQKAAITGKLSGAPWKPRKRLSPDAMDGIRALHEQYPEEFTTAVLAKRFEISPEAIRRILRSKWQPSEEEDEDRRLRWSKRGESIWQKNAELGIKPPKKWRDLGITRHLNDHVGPI
ncbi:MAG: hypothetical protein M1825_002871 [Sarcosagium campestre]|nr:MAG: hypothetical protein M1825_002871 [Sarcosagium campestre]